MANKLSLGLVIGGAVSSTVGAAFKDVTGRIKRLETDGNKARVLQRTIGDTIRLRDEWKKAHDSGAAGASKLLGRLNSNLDSLKKQGVEVGRLDKAYRSLGQTANKAELKAKGYQQVEAGKAGMKSTVGQAVAGVATVAIATKVSADFGAIVRDIAIKAGIANDPKEKQMSQTIIETSRETGMARNDVADVVNQLVSAGMDLAKALEYAPVAAKFAVGQGSNGADTAKMINALGQNARITDANQMQQALEAIAFQGQAGSFEAVDMARWFPELLSNMGNLNITGMDAVTQLGAMLQVQMKTAGGADEAANNLKNWMGKIGSTDTVTAYQKAGIDYKASMQTGLQNGMSTLESSMALAQKYIQTTDPKRAALMAEATAKISEQADPEKAKAMMASLEEALRTGDLFADMQVKAALSAYLQNKALYSKLKSDSREASGILDKNLAERRESSSQKWAETTQAMNDALRSAGDALRPVTDTVAEGLTKVTKGITALSDSSPGVVAGIAAVGGGLLALKTLVSTYKIGKGLFNLARGTLGKGKSDEVQKVFITNSAAGDRVAPGAELKGKAGKALSLVETGLKAVAAVKGVSEGSDTKDGQGDKKAGGLDLVATGLKVVSLAKEAAVDGDLQAGLDDGSVRKVYVVNAAAMGGGGPFDNRRRTRGVKRSSSRRRRPPEPPRSGGASRAPVIRPRPAEPLPRAPAPVPRPPVPIPAPRPAAPMPRAHVPLPGPSVPVASNMLTKVGVVAGAVGKVGQLGKVIPGGSLLEAGSMAFDTYQNATTQDEKAEGYGAAAGSLAGTMAGAAAGAAIGSVVPIIGTAIGGMVGAYLGSLGGTALGGVAGKSWFGAEESKPSAPVTPLLMAPRPGPVVPSLASMELTFGGSRESGALLMAAPTTPPGPALGDVARALAVPVPAKPEPMVLQPKEPAKPVPTKVDQQFQYSLNMPVTVQGDVKDPQRLAQDLMPHMQRMMADAAKQSASNQLFDDPHL
ncbi:phage tail tape measure protein [Pseudomonas izuensis]|uniref:Phage tail tape measure protein n=1 Tax=Pseudomonas izuensis TaxID=2684212 RepID=A0ABM7RTX9_9PSED|nr:phage tail tape measure protein [Pseudomonas izuensis]BCX67977.1 phage tail tape measure protein [Pseudomonas izuensis]